LKVPRAAIYTPLLRTMAGWRATVALAAAALSLPAAAFPQLIAPPTQGLTRIVLLVDSSSAVGSHVNAFRNALTTFLDTLPGTPEMTLISMGGQLRVRVPPTSDRARLRTGAESFAPDGGGNVLVDALLEADRRFLRDAVVARPVFVVLTTDSGEMRGEPRIDQYNRFVGEFIQRRGLAHAVVVRGRSSGIISDIARNFADNTRGLFEIVNADTAAPLMMKNIAIHLAASHQLD
jgi:hypothetical protein